MRDHEMEVIMFDGRKINNLRYTEDTALVADSEETLKRKKTKWCSYRKERQVQEQIL